MISKELLGEVLDIEIFDFTCGKSTIWYFKCVNSEFEHSINIYELAHKCKEWAYENGFLLSSGIKWKDRVYCDVFIPFKFEECEHSFNAKTEPEAIFKACQWILDNKVKK